MKRASLKQIISLILVFCIIATLALAQSCRHPQPVSEPETPTVPQSTIVINTTKVGRSVTGYKGQTPLKIYITGGKIDSVAGLPNQETPGYWRRASALLHSWDGMEVNAARAKHVDAVTGATYSSVAILNNLRLGLDEAIATHPELAAKSTDKVASSEPEFWTISMTAALLVALAAAILPLFIRNKRYRFVQQLLNVSVLGFWTGTFVDYAVILRFCTQTVTFTLSTVLMILLFIVAFIYPLFGARQHYCLHICPMGSAQDIMHTLGPNRRKYDLKKKIRTVLINFRRILWILLMVSLWTGVLASWIDYEIFSAFIVQSASIAVMVVAGLFLLISLIIARPFCRFVCPVGTLLKLSEGRY